MATVETTAFMAALICLGLSLILAIWRFVAVKIASAQTANGLSVNAVSSSRLPNTVTLAVSVLSLVCLSVSIIARAVITGHGPFSNMYEFALAFSWGIVAVGLFFWWRFQMAILSTVGMIIALGLLLFADTLPSQAVPLVPALQQSVLLSTHVASAVISYGAFTTGFGAALIYLLKGVKADPAESARLDDISYYAVMIGFPFMTLVIVLGALWADRAWGTYWSWDPKETASLVTWLLYASYLHARVLRGWRGKKAAILMVIGFIAVIMTFFGNYIFSGLHSYQ
jgi:ABC-type transport system involved in cytochrome c biogenesis permease subunit